MPAMGKERNNQETNRTMKTESIIEAMRQLVAESESNQARILQLESSLKTYQNALKILCRQREQKWTVDEIQKAIADPRTVAVCGFGLELLTIETATETK